MDLLKRIRIAGWKSIKNQTIDLTPLTVVIGANGAGKSNLLSVFKLLQAMFGEQPRFPNYVAYHGFADSLLHYGSKQTPNAELELTWILPTGELTYLVRWAAAAAGALTFEAERLVFQQNDLFQPRVIDLGAGHSETNLIDAAEANDPLAQAALIWLRSCALFHFHDTSERCAARAPSLLESNRGLYPDAGNLAAMLYRFKEKEPTAYRRITATVRQIIPDFDHFVLEPSKLNEKQILLNWTHKGQDYEFGPHQLSDGSLRLIALATLLLQPIQQFPVLIALDEPELGLHPSALEILAGLAKAASSHTQVVLATQSPAFLDYFEPEDVVVVNSHAGTSEFERLDSDKLADWLANYTLGEVWAKNVVGGGPYG